MKTFFFYSLMLLGLATAYAQNDTEIHTKSIKIEDFISYIASLENTPREQRIYIALGVGPKGLNGENRFFLEQGIILLSKRLTKESLIAIGLYGSQGRVLMPYTLIQEIDNLSSYIKAIEINKPSPNVDGINLAFETAKFHGKEGIDNSVFLILNNNSTTDIVENTTGVKTTDVHVKEKEKTTASNHTKLGGAIALTALTILPDVLEIIKN